jgi:predicted metal-dependent peptidase
MCGTAAGGSTCFIARLIARPFRLERYDGVNKVEILIDTSGSMDEKALTAVRSETQAPLDDGAINEVVVVYGDTYPTPRGLTKAAT